MRYARPTVCAAILLALWLGTAWADSYAIDVILPAPATLTAVLSTPRGGLGATIDYNPRAHEDAEKQVRAFLRENLTP